jgi:hypothetical protein
MGYFDGEDDSYASNALTYSNEIIKHNRTIINKALYSKSDN